MNTATEFDEHATLGVRTTRVESTVAFVQHEDIRLLDRAHLKVRRCAELSYMLA